jgi:hypothetical protein
VSERVDAVPGWRTALLGLLGLAVVAQLVVLYAPAQPAGLPLFVHADKVVHALVFLVPTAVALLAGFRPWVVVAVFGGHAVVSEVVQGVLLPSRAGDPLDVLADLTGVALGVLVWRSVAATGTSPTPQ